MNETMLSSVVGDIITTTSAAVSEITETESTHATIQEQVTKTATLLERMLIHIKNAIPSLIMAVVILIVGMLIVRLASGFAKKTLKKSNIDGAARSFLVSLIRIILYMVVVLTVLSVLNVPMSSIITIFGAAGLAVSLALQNCLSNLCGGFIILFSKPFVAGDTIELDGSVGNVKSISILYTKILTFDGKTIFIPNGKVSDAKIINYTESPERRIDLIFDIGYNSDFRKARELILKIIDEDKLLLKTPEPIVRMTAHNESSVSIDVKVFVKNDDYNTARYNMIESVKEAFDENGIEIPYNQLDIHIKDVVS